MTTPQTLIFQKISQVDRFHEPVTVSVPFAQGTLNDPRRFVIYDGKYPLPLQRRVLARWPDGSTKWLLVHFQVDLPGNAGYSLSYGIAEQPVSLPEPAYPITVTQDEHGLTVDTRVLRFAVPSTGFLPLTGVALDGKRLWTDSPFRGFHLQIQEQPIGTGSCPVELEVEEAGPLRAVVNVRGKHHTAQGEPYLDLRGRIVAYAGKPYVEVEYGFFHCEEEDSLDLHQARLPIDFSGTRAAQLALGEGYYRTRIQQSSEQVELTLAIDVGIYPAGSTPAQIRQGVGKTHRLLLHFHDGSAPLDEISLQSLQFQLPDRPALPPQWFTENNPWECATLPLPHPRLFLSSPRPFCQSLPAFPRSRRCGRGDSAAADEHSRCRPPSESRTKAWVGCRSSPTHPQM